MGTEFDSSHYDVMYSAGGYEGIYDLPYRHSSYYPMFEEAWRRIRRHRSVSVLEVGCGNGAFASLLFDRGLKIRYRGFDFSPVAVSSAVSRTRKPDMFFVGDASDVRNYQGDFDTIVCTEVLEHIAADLDIVAKWPVGTYCVCSVPNFDADTHVRFFSSEAEVRARYGKLIAIDAIERIKKPFLSNLSWRSRLQAIRWNRYRPRRLLQIFGVSSFSQAGGWFVFSGRRVTDA